MFLQWSFFEMNLFFLALDLAVATAFAATLAHISHRFQGHTHSIRWIKQAGLLEMVKALGNSFQKVTGRLWLGLLATFFGGLALTAILVFAKSFVNIATAEEGRTSTEVVASEQLVLVNLLTSLPEWSIPVPYDTSMADALTGALVNTKAIPRASPKRRYRPRVSEYQIACDRIDVRALAEGSLHIRNDGCANITIIPAASMKPNATRSYIRQRSKGRATVFMSGRAEDGKIFNIPGTVNDVSILFGVYYTHHACVTGDFSPQLISVTRNGIVSSPATILTSTLLPTGEMISFSTASVRFFAPTREMFHSVAESLFGDQNDLVAGMQESVNNGTLTNLPPDPLEQIIVMEVKTVGTTVTTLICSGSRRNLAEHPHIVCVYSITNVLILKSRAINPDIVMLLPNRSLAPPAGSRTVLMSLFHLPLNPTEKKPEFAISKILNSSAVAADYLASLGQNFILDWEGAMLYAAYDITEIVKGYEIPRGLFCSMIGVMVVCFLFWAATESFVDGRYKRSLLWQVSQELAPPEGKFSPRLHRFDPVDLEFGGRRIVSTKVPRMLEGATLYQGSILGSQDPLTADV